MRLLASPLAALLLALSVATAAKATPMFTGLGYLPGDSNSVALAVSGDGSTVVGTSGQASTGGSEGFRWTLTDGMASLGETTVRANDASYDGSVIVGLSGQQAFVWTADDGAVGIGIPDTYAEGVSADGSFVAGIITGPVRDAFRWSADLGLQDLAATTQDTIATAISASGNVVVGTSGQEGFIWNPEQGSTFKKLGFSSNVWNVSADGTTLVGVSSTKAFSWSEATGTVWLGFTGYAYAASADGSVVVGQSTSGGANARAMIWTAEDGAREVQDVLADLGLDLSGWTLITAHDVSDDGTTLVGVGLNSAGKQEAWVAIIPEPCTGLLLGAGLLALRVMRRRRVRRLTYYP